MLDEHPGIEEKMDWYLMVWSKFAEFDGRSRRTEYWMFVLINFLVIIALAIVGALGLAFMGHSSGIGAVLFVPLGLYVLAMIIPGLAVSVRRLHDSGKSGWLLLLLTVLGVIPLIGFIASVVQIVLMCQDSNPGMNQYGPNPKFPGQGVGVFAGYAGFAPVAPTAQPMPFMGVNNFRVCGKCGAKLHGASSFCGACGAQA
jgi:uncharacterized membrane protein YhaH (DUF805 family)